MRICYWNIRGICHSLQEMCEYLELPYEMKVYTDPKEWFDDKQNFIEGNFPMANLPYLEDKEGLGEERISDSCAIMVYIA